MPYTNLRLREVHTPQERLEFIKFPWRIYAHDPNWVPPLISERKAFFDPKKNPSFGHMDVALFLLEGTYVPGPDRAVEPRDPRYPVLKDGIVGRIAAVVNHLYNEVHNDRVGFFGFFESVNDVDVARFLLETAERWVADRGMRAILGPMNFSTNDECAFLIEGFDSPPVFLMPYNPPYYPALMEAVGYEKAMDLWAHLLDHTQYRSMDDLPPKLLRVVRAVQKRHPEVRVRKMRKKDLRNEIDRFKQVYNKAWEKNWGFVPLTDEEIEHMAQDLVPLIDEDLAFFAEVQREDGTWMPIAASLTLPDYNQVLIHLNGRLFPFGWLKFLWYKRQIDTARIFALGVIHEWHGKGIDALLYYETGKELFRKGYKRAEMGWTLEINDAVNRTIRFFGGRVYKKYRIYQKSLTS